jgi:hypothetical protein
MIEIGNTILSAGITLCALVLCYISIASYRKHKTNRLLYVSIVFFVFLIKGILMSLSIFIDEFAFFTYNIYFAALDFFMLIILFIAILKE